jgi:hypothetical protein
MEADFESVEYFQQNKKLTEEDITDFRNHVECFTRTQSTKNKQLAQSIIEIARKKNDLAITYHNSIGEIFEDDIELSLLNLINLLKVDNSIRFSFVNANYQRILEIFAIKKEFNPRLVLETHAVLIKTLSSAVVFEENNYSIADKICDVYLSAFKSMINLIVNKNYNDAAPLVLSLFIKIYESVTEPIIYQNLCAENRSLGYLIIKLQGIALKSIKDLRASFYDLDLAFRVNVLYFVSMVLIYEKRAVERKTGPLSNAFQFTIFAKHSDSIRFYIGACLNLISPNNRFDSSLLKKLSRSSFYFSAFIQQSDDHVNLSERTMETLLNNLNSGILKNCLPQAISQLPKVLSAEKNANLVKKALEKICASKLTDSLTFILLYQLFEAADKEDIQIIFQISDISTALRDRNSNFGITFSISYLFFNASTSQGPFYRTHFQMLHKILQLSTIQTNSQVSLLKIYFKKLLNENGSDFLENVNEICEEIEIKLNFLYLLVLVCCMLKAKQKVEKFYFNLYEKIKENLFEYSQALEDNQVQKYLFFDLVYKHSRKFSYRLEASSPEIAVKIKTLLKNFCLNQKDFINSEPSDNLKNDKALRKITDTLVESKVHKFQKIFSSHESCETIKKLISIQINSVMAKYQPKHYVTNNNYFSVFESEVFKISPIYELCGLIDPIQLNLEILITNGQCFARVTLVNSSGTLIKNLTIDFQYYSGTNLVHSEQTHIDNSPPNQRKVYNFKIELLCIKSLKIRMKAWIKNLERNDEELILDEEDVGVEDNNIRSDSHDSGDLETADRYEISCKSVEISPIWYFYKVEFNEMRLVNDFAKKAFHLKWEKELTLHSQKLIEFSNYLGIDLRKGFELAILKSFHFDKFFLMEVNKKGADTLQIVLRTHSRSVFFFVVSHFG